MMFSATNLLLVLVSIFVSVLRYSDLKHGTDDVIGPQAIQKTSTDCTRSSQKQAFEAWPPGRVMCFSIRTRPTSPPLPRDDVGCYAARAKALRIHLYYPHINVPSCVEGGFYRHYQCRLGYPCYCVFVDTGNSFPVIAPSNKLFYRFFVFGQFAAHACPVKRELESPGNDCQNPPLNYPCDLSQTKYTFNVNTQTCEATTGCSGFSNRSDCEASCSVQVLGPCSLPLDFGVSCSNKVESTRYRHDPLTGECQSFTYNGCGGNSNNYGDMWDCQRTCVSQVNVSVLVRVRQRITYNLTLPLWVVNRYELDLAAATDVDDVTFAAIGEYVSSFRVVVDEDHDDSRALSLFANVQKQGKSDEELQREVFPSHIICAQNLTTGPCRAYFPRWFYDPARQKCFKFVYGGCAGNGNNFESADDCTQYCQAPFTPSPLELIAPPTDPSTGVAIPDPRGAYRCEKNSRGELICRVPETTPPAPTPSVAYEEEEEE